MIKKISYAMFAVAIAAGAALSQDATTAKKGPGPTLLQPQMEPTGGWAKQGDMGSKGEKWSATTVGASVDGNEHRQGTERSHVLADEVLVASQRTRQDGENRLQLELAVERGSAEDDRHQDRVERDRRRPQIGDDPQLLVERERGHDERVRTAREGEGEETIEDARAHRFAVGIQRNHGYAFEHVRHYLH